MARSAPDSDVFATVQHVTNVFPDGVTRTDRTTTFTKNITVDNYFEWMSSHDLNVPQLGRIGRGFTTLDEIDTYTKVSAPATPTASTSGLGGTLAAATYRYVVTALSEGGETLPSSAVTQATTGSTSTVTVQWTTVSNATGYRIYGRANSVDRAVLLATVGPAVTSWIDDGSVPAFGQAPPKVSTARRLDDANTATDTAVSDTANWTVWKDIPTGFCFGNIYDRDSVAARTGIGGGKVRIEKGSGIRKQYYNLYWPGSATTTITGGTVWTATHYSYIYLPQDPNGRWEWEIAARSSSMSILNSLYPAS